MNPTSGNPAEQMAYMAQWLSSVLAGGDADALQDFHSAPSQSLPAIQIAPSIPGMTPAATQTGALSHPGPVTSTEPELFSVKGRAPVVHRIAADVSADSLAGTGKNLRAGVDAGTGMLPEHSLARAAR